ncbi:Hypothetical protein NocV09_01800020 [Nannochloropsis oceanica]
MSRGYPILSKSPPGREDYEKAGDDDQEGKMYEDDSVMVASESEEGGLTDRDIQEERLAGSKRRRSQSPSPDFHFSHAPSLSESLQERLTGLFRDTTTRSVAINKTYFASFSSFWRRFEEALHPFSRPLVPFSIPESLRRWLIETPSVHALLRHLTEGEEETGLRKGLSARCRTALAIVLEHLGLRMTQPWEGERRIVLLLESLQAAFLHPMAMQALLVYHREKEEARRRKDRVAAQTMSALTILLAVLDLRVVQLESSEEKKLEVEGKEGGREGLWRSWKGEGGDKEDETEEEEGEEEGLLMSRNLQRGAAGHFVSGCSRRRAYRRLAKAQTASFTPPLYTLYRLTLKSKSSSRSNSDSSSSSNSNSSNTSRASRIRPSLFHPLTSLPASVQSAPAAIQTVAFEVYLKLPSGTPYSSSSSSKTTSSSSSSKTSSSSSSSSSSISNHNKKDTNSRNISSSNTTSTSSNATSTSSSSNGSSTSSSSTSSSIISSSIISSSSTITISSQISFSSSSSSNNSSGSSSVTYISSIVEPSSFSTFTKAQHL